MKKQISMVLAIVFTLTFVVPTVSDAQRMKHGASKSRPQAAKAQTGSRGSINGGAQTSAKRPTPKVSTGDRNASRGGNTVNVDKSKKNVNVNIDNSKNVKVRKNTRVYGRPPHVYGGRRYYCYHPYHYHPYRPFYWGPHWHPWGFFVATLAVTAIVINVASQPYHYDQGIYYVQSGGGYTVVAAPVGATITTLPQGSQTVVVNETTNNYYYGGTYYEKSGGGYTVVAPTAGTVVKELPEGGEEVKIGDVTYVKVGETYYQPIERDGESMYEVVQVEEGES